MHIIQMVLQGFKLLYISLTLVNFRLRKLKPTLPLQGLWQRTLPGVGALGGGWGGGERPAGSCMAFSPWLTDFSPHARHGSIKKQVPSELCLA